MTAPARKRVQCLNEALRFVSSSVMADSFVLRDRQLLAATNRYRSSKKTTCYPNVSKSKFNLQL
jgi:hypothetical protein